MGRVVRDAGRRRHTARAPRGLLAHEPGAPGGVLRGHRGPAGRARGAGDGPRQLPDHVRAVPRGLPTDGVPQCNAAAVEQSQRNRAVFNVSGASVTHIETVYAQAMAMRAARIAQAPAAGGDRGAAAVRLPGARLGPAGRVRGARDRAADWFLRGHPVRPAGGQPRACATRSRATAWTSRAT